MLLDLRQVESGMLQRLIDIAGAVVGLILASPLLLAIAWLIRIDDGGPVLFTQNRIGTRRKVFRIYKFRTMRDGRITRVGRWLRATGLDEVPQLVNMLRGEMTLIGPRPLTPEDVERLGWNDDLHAVRWSVRPGIIGLAQLYAGRGKRLSWFLDSTYVRRRRLGLDLGIVAATALIGLVGKQRVRRWLRERRRVSVAQFGSLRSQRLIHALRRPSVPSAESVSASMKRWHQV